VGLVNEVILEKTVTDIRFPRCIPRISSQNLRMRELAIRK
jgi:hypothetical protein